GRGSGAGVGAGAVAGAVAGADPGAGARAGAGAGVGARAGAGAGAVAGHSLGEYSALVVAGVLSSVEGARLVAARGDAMAAAAAARPGTMAAVLGLGPDGVAKACADVDGVWVANDNAPGQIVIAGTAEGVAQAGDAARGLGAKRVVPLAVGGAFHSPLMASAQSDLDAALADADFHDGSIDCVANVDAEAHRAAGDWRRLLSAQLTSQVRWRESVLRLDRLGVTRYVELGPGGELSGMVKRIIDGAVRITVGVPDDIAALG
ncbi:MAG: ACP S-malonyltransferase, partial [Acidimicrobiales bacterium]